MGSVLVANRGEIARRIIRTAKRLGIRAIAVYSEADADLPFVREADEAVLHRPGQPCAELPATPRRSSTRPRRPGRRAIHPGYGFLAENAEFARAVSTAGLIWVGPGAGGDRAMGDKINARNLMEAAGVPVAPGTREPVADVDAARGRRPSEIGYPVMVKAAGRRRRHRHGRRRTTRRGCARRTRRRAARAERIVRRRRHPARALLRRGPATSRCRSSAWPTARVVALGERECSVQRRHQKVVEETPSPGRRRRAARADARRGGAGRRGGRLPQRRHRRVPGRRGRADFFFLEMNTRLQVEHPVTELVTGIDLVEQQLRVAAGEPLTVRPGRVGRQRARDRAAGLRRGPEAVPARRPARSRRGSSRPARASASTPATTRATRSRRSTTR